MTSEEVYDSDSNVFKKIIEDIIVAINAQNQIRFAEYDQKIEKIEQQLATLVLAYGETAVFLEALVGQIAFASEDAQKSFHESLSQSRKSMLEVMQSAADGFLGDEDPVIGAAISDLVEKKLSETDQSE
jgi:hypothetical protein